MKKFLNQKGLSLPEITIALGITGLIALGVSKMMGDLEQTKSVMDKEAETGSIQKIIESQFASADGCNMLIGKRVGDELSYNKGGIHVSKDHEIGHTQIKTFSIKDFTPVSDDGVTGIVHIALHFQRRNSPRVTMRYMPVSVNMVNGKVEDCNQNHTRALQMITDKVCEGTFGTATQGMSCQQAILAVENAVIRSICIDVYGKVPTTGVRRAPMFNGASCNLALIHASQFCSNGYVNGFDGDGNITCLPAVNGQSCTATTWSPDPSTQCSGVAMTQTSNCGTTRGNIGTSTTGACAPNPGCNDVAWSPDPTTVCNGLAYTQTSNCGNSRQASGTDTTSPACVVNPTPTPTPNPTPNPTPSPTPSPSQSPQCIASTWSPDPSTKCSGVTFQQTSNCKTQQTAVGTDTGPNCGCMVWRPISWKHCAELGAAGMVPYQSFILNDDTLMLEGGAPGLPGGPNVVPGQFEGQYRATCQNGQMVIDRPATYCLHTY